jgi:hypothetical protein
MPRKKKGSESADGSSELERSNKQQRRGSPHKKKRNKNKIKVNDEQFREALEGASLCMILEEECASMLAFLLTVYHYIRY